MLAPNGTSLDASRLDYYVDTWPKLREELIAKLPGEIAVDSNTKRDKKVLRDMLERVAASKVDDDDSIQSMFRDLVKTQYSLLPATRHRLAR